MWRQQRQATWDSCWWKRYDPAHNAFWWHTNRLGLHTRERAGWWEEHSFHNPTHSNPNPKRFVDWCRSIDMMICSVTSCCALVMQRYEISLLWCAFFLPLLPNTNPMPMKKAILLALLSLVAISKLSAQSSLQLYRRQLVTHFTQKLWKISWGGCSHSAPRNRSQMCIWWDTPHFRRIFAVSLGSWWRISTDRRRFNRLSSNLCFYSCWLHKSNRLGLHRQLWHRLHLVQHQRLGWSNAKLHYGNWFQQPCSLQWYRYPWTSMDFHLQISWYN